MPTQVFEANIVGMRFYATDKDTLVSLLPHMILLRRDRDNLHDPNAIAAVVSGKVIGHIDRKSAALLGPVLDAGGSSSVVSTSVGLSAIAVGIRVNREVPKSRAPEIIRGSRAGIYCISVAGADQNYVGQARDLNRRIQAHWDQLCFGLHSNPKMQSLWTLRGQLSFSARALELAPSELSELELSHWLVGNERKWIAHFKQLQTSLNRIEPQIVFSAKAIDQARREHAQREKERKEKRVADKARLRELQEEIAKLRTAAWPLDNQIATDREFCRRTRVLWGAFASKHDKAMLPVREQRLAELLRKKAPLDELIKVISSEITALKAQLRPKRRRSRRWTY